MDEPLYPRESLHCFQVIHVLYIDMFNFYLFIYLWFFTYYGRSQCALHHSKFCKNCSLVLINKDNMDG